MTKLQTLPAASSDDAKAGRSGKGPRRRESRGSLAFSRSARIKGLVKHAILIIVGGVMIYPLLWMVVSSLRPNDLIFREPGLWLENLEMSNYTDGWSALTHPFGHYMINSAIVVLGSILGNLISCSMAAYAFARLQFSGKKIFFGIMLLTIMLPFHVVIVPQYILFSQIGWVNTFWPLIVPKLLATDAFFVFLMVQFIRGIPKDLDEAARIDGAGHPRIFLRVILPLMVPALATTTIFTFIWTWNDFFGALIYLTDPDMFTVPVALRAFVDSQSATSWGSLFAMSIVSLLPVFLVFLFGQRFLIKGIATTGIK
ncbi:multiple sugar transport system permease protein [Paenarthrobacter nicotinovorans]|uniref:Carbohydrate ABC transporter permease n=1 Tax=Paenarthrobacter nicotinovorans TaxID=29320 RepID=A0ABV0GV37_PAENI|nr:MULTISPECIES: carbohydrate ABC transporter permease [Micrococcaceae]MDR6435220.1 multiple sugar transport system permease protein [Paenarthrobacter nicotinovorans]BCW60083.1 sugar ABC transporter permease [Arthrobacter sp. StoSoilB20]SCZ49226.1 carbohydrate ABC transporter membrane protein 2, CUT1 family [Arthrobacter sp. UNCCL28]